MGYESKIKGGFPSNQVFGRPINTCKNSCAGTCAYSCGYACGYVCVGTCTGGCADTCSINCARECADGLGKMVVETPGLSY